MRLKLFVSGLLLCCTLAQAQILPNPLVVSTGEATVYGTPSHVAFELRGDFRKAETLVKAMQNALAYEAKVKELLAQYELQPSSITFTPPSIPEISDRTVLVHAEVRFALTPFGQSETALVAIAEICDKMATLADQISIIPAIPQWIAEDEDTLKQAAVQAALEDAFPGADAAAITLKSTVFSVDTIEILAMEQVRSLEASLKGEANLQQIPFRAKVRVTYTLVVDQQ